MVIFGLAMNCSYGVAISNEELMPSRYRHEFRKFARVRQRFDAPNRIDDLIDVLLTQDRLHQPRRFLLDFLRAHGIFRTAAAIDHMFAQRSAIFQSNLDKPLEAMTGALHVVI